MTCSRNLSFSDYPIKFLRFCNQTVLYKNPYNAFIIAIAISVHLIRLFCTRNKRSGPSRFASHSGTIHLFYRWRQYLDASFHLSRCGCVCYCACVCCFPFFSSCPLFCCFYLMKYNEMVGQQQVALCFAVFT